MSSTALMINLRAKLTGASDENIKTELFNTVDDLIKEALIDETPPSDPTASEATWLSSALYTTHYQVLLAGTLARMYAHNDRPWSSDALAAAYGTRYQALLQLARQDDAADTEPASVYDRLMANLRVRFPPQREGALRLEIYNVCDKIRKDALRLAPLTDADTTPSLWLPADKWDDCYLALLEGCLARLYSTHNAPFSNPQLGAAYHALFRDELELVRTDITPTSVYERLMANLRVAAPMARDEQLHNALWNAADKIRKEALRLAPLDDAVDDTDPTTWLPTANWDESYQALLHGTLADVYSMGNQAWAKPEIAAAHTAAFIGEIEFLRTDTAPEADGTVYARLLAALRAEAPQVRDSVIKHAVYITADKIRKEALRVAPLTDASTTPSLWLTDWDSAYQAVFHGALYHIFTQVGRPWASGDMAAAHLAPFMAELELLRTDVAPESAATVYDRLYTIIRSEVPTARDTVIRQAIYTAADKIRVDALRLAALTDADTTPASWLPNWGTAYQAVLSGTLYNLYSQQGRPWSAPDLAAANMARFTLELEFLRTDVSIDGLSVYNRIFTVIRSEVPGVRDSVIRQAIYTTADKLRKDYLRLDALDDADTTATSWLPNWDIAYQAVYHGALSFLYSQPGRPWNNEALAAAHAAAFASEAETIRSDTAPEAGATVYDRILISVRTHIPTIRDSLIKQEVYTVIDKLRKEALRLAPLADADTTPSSWLPAAKWDDCYQAVLAGVLFRLYSQTAKPWSNPDLAKAQYLIYGTELELVRVDNTDADNTAFQRTIDEARMHLPGARDNVIQIAFTNALDEFLTKTGVWWEDITITTTAGTLTYSLFPSSYSTIKRLVHVKDANDLPVAATIPDLTFGDLVFKNDPGTGTFTARVALSIGEARNRDGYPIYPHWVVDHYHMQILSGLTSSAMMQPGKSYSNERLGIFYGRKFQDAIARARFDARRENTFGAQVWRYPQTFATTRRT